MNHFLDQPTVCKEEKAIILHAKDAIKLLAFEFAINRTLKPESIRNGELIKNNLLILMTGPLEAAKIKIAAHLSTNAGKVLRILDGSMPKILPAATEGWETLLERATDNNEVLFIKNAPLLFGRVSKDRFVKFNLKRVLGLVKYYQVPVIASGLSVGQFCSSFTNCSVGSIQICE